MHIEVQAIKNLLIYKITHIRAEAHFNLDIQSYIHVQIEPCFNLCIDIYRPNYNSAYFNGSMFYFKYSIMCL